MKLAKVELGQVFILNGNQYIRIGDRPDIQEKYPNSIMAFNIFTYDVVVINGDYEVLAEDETPEIIEYQGEVHNDKCD